MAHSGHRNALPGKAAIAIDDQYNAIDFKINVLSKCAQPCIAMVTIWGDYLLWGPVCSAAYGRGWVHINAS